MSPAVPEPPSPPAASTDAVLPAAAPPSVGGGVRAALDRRPRLEGYLGALLGSLLVVLAMPDIGLGLPIVVALVPALALARTRPWRARLRLGWLMGFLYHVALFRWIPFTLTEMTPIPLPVTWVMWFLYAAWHGLMVGVFLALSEPVRRATVARAPALGAVAVALAFVAVEAAWPTIFPWSLGQALWQVGPAAAIQAFFGVPGLAFFVALANAAAVELWLARRGPAAMGPAPGAPRRAIVAAAATLGALLAAGTGWYLHAAGATPDRTLRVAIVQPNYTIEEKKHATAEMRKRLLTRLDGQLRSVAPGRFDLVVASEGSFPLLWRLDAETAGAAEPAVVATRQILAAVAEGPHTEAIIGGLRSGDVVPPAPGEPKGKTTRKIHNAAVHITADGKLAGHYDKRVLVPFSEYMPLSSLIPSLKGSVPGVGNFDPGDELCRFDVAGVHVACGICYETMFPGDMRAALGDDGRALLNLTIDTWFGKDVAPEMHLMTHASRAVELGVPLVRAALTGISALVLPTGEVAASLPLDVAGVLPVDVPLTDLATPYRAWGPVFLIVATAAAALALADALRRRRELFPPRVVSPGQDARLGP